MSKKDRLEQYLKYKSIGPTAFSKRLGISNSHVSEIDTRKSNRTLFLAIKSSTDYSDCNVSWIETGEGEMLVKPDEYPHGLDKFKQAAVQAETISKTKAATHGEEQPPDRQPSSISEQLSGYSKEVRWAADWMEMKVTGKTAEERLKQIEDMMDLLRKQFK